MMNRKKTLKKELRKYALIIPLALFALIGNSANRSIFSVSDLSLPGISIDVFQEAQKDNEEPFTVVDQMPKFPGEMNGLIEYMRNTLKYPEEAYKNGIEGRVVVRFVVQKDGSVSDAVVTKSLNPVCDAEALRVVNEMPAWEPGVQKGKKVPVFFSLPIEYKLQ